MDNWCERTELMFGGDNLNALNAANILVVGVGGVGAFAAETIPNTAV